MRRVRWLRVVVNVRFFGVLLVFFSTLVIVAVGQVVVVVLVGMPKRPMFPFATYSTLVMMRDVVMVVCMGLRRMCMMRLFAFALGKLLGHESPSL
jgi:hypothetical protein